MCGLEDWMFNRAFPGGGSIGPARVHCSLLWQAARPRGMEMEAVSCECCRLEEECTGDSIGDVRSYFGVSWLCAGNDVEGTVHAHMAICHTLQSARPAGRVAVGMRRLLHAASVRRTSSSSSSYSSNWTVSSPREYHRASSALSVGI